MMSKYNTPSKWSNWHYEQGYTKRNPYNLGLNSDHYIWLCALYLQILNLNRYKPTDLT